MSVKDKRAKRAEMDIRIHDWLIREPVAASKLDWEWLPLGIKASDHGEGWQAKPVKRLEFPR